MELEDQAVLKTNNVKAIVSLLQIMKSTGKQVCNVSVEADGLRVRWEEESKSLQSSVFLRSELFTEIAVPRGGPPVTFAMPSHHLLDTLNVFAAAFGGSCLALTFPGPNAELLLAMVEDVCGRQVTTYASVATVEAPAAGDLMDMWCGDGPASYFLCGGGTMKEVVEDLEWTGGHVALAMRRDPPRLALSSHGQGSLEVEVSTSELSGFQVGQPELHHCYRHKHMRAAFTSLHSGSKDSLGAVSTKVNIDANGLLQVTHMVMLPGAGGPAAGGGGGAGFGATQPGGTGGMPLASALLASQRLAGGGSGGSAGVVQFIIQPVMLMDDD